MQRFAFRNILKRRAARVSLDPAAEQQRQRSRRKNQVFDQHERGPAVKPQIQQRRGHRQNAHKHHHHDQQYADVEVVFDGGIFVFPVEFRRHDVYKQSEGVERYERDDADKKYRSYGPERYPKGHSRQYEGYHERRKAHQQTGNNLRAHLCRVRHRDIPRDIYIFALARYGGSARHVHDTEKSDDPGSNTYEQKGAAVFAYVELAQG